MTMLSLLLMPIVWAGDFNYTCPSKENINIAFDKAGVHYFGCPSDTHECNYLVSVSNESEPGAEFLLKRASDAAAGCTVWISPRSSSSPMFSLAPASGTASITIQDVHIRPNPDTEKNHNNFIILSTPDTDAKVTIKLDNVEVAGQQESAFSFISVGDGTTITIKDSSLTWASAATSGQLLYAADSVENDDKPTSVTISNSVILAGSSGEPASLMQMAGGASLTLDKTLVRAGANSNATTLIDLTGGSTASLTNTLVVGEAKSGLGSLFNATKDSSLTLSATTLDLNVEDARALPEFGTLALTNVVLTGLGNLDVDAVGTKSNVYVSDYTNDVDSLALGSLADLNDSVPDWAKLTLTLTTSVCWDVSVEESCVEALEVWPSLCSPTWGDGTDALAATPAGFLHGGGDSPTWPAQLTTLVAWRDEAWYVYYAVQPDPSDPKWQVVPCYDSTTTTAACTGNIPNDLTSIRPKSWLDDAGVPVCALVEDPPDTDAGTTDDTGVISGHLQSAGPGCPDPTTSSAALLFSGLSGLFALRRRRTRPPSM